jgi:hypothetical protein
MDLIFFLIYPLILSLIVIPFLMVTFWSNENTQVRKFIRPLFFLPVCFFCFVLIYFKYMAFTEDCYQEFSSDFYAAHTLMCGFEVVKNFPLWLFISTAVDSVVLLLFARSFGLTRRPFNMFFISSAYFAFVSPLAILLFAVFSH